jgi:hypothetical protein
MIVLRKKSDNTIWIAWEDAITVTLDATKVSSTDGTTTTESSTFTNTDYEVVTDITLPDGFRDGGCYSYDGSSWVVVNSALKNELDAIDEAEKTAQGR